MSIYVWAGRINYPAMRWPCPYGYHVPRETEWNDIKTWGTTIWAWTSSGGTNFSTYLKLPFAWWRGASTGAVANQWTLWSYWQCELTTASNGKFLYVNATYILPWYGTSPKNWYSIRPFKDEPVVPTSSWTTLYDWSWTATGAGIFWNSSSGLISISKDGTTWYTIADKNLWATTVYNSWDTLSEANCWKYFQRWNNYPFVWTGSVTTSSSQVDASGYWPWNWYYRSTFVTGSGDRSSVQNQNLRWWVVWAVKADVKDICVGAGVDDYSPMQWPCPDGFHVGKNTDWNELKWLWVAIYKYFKLPLAWRWSGATKYGVWSTWFYWSTSPSGTINALCAQIANTSTNANATSWYPRREAFSIRPFKDVPVVPDSSWTTLYDGSGTAPWAWIFWNKWLWLISKSSDWTTWITMADKNLGAKVVYNDWDTLSQYNCGYYYQRWNNYWFWFSSVGTTSTTKPDAIWFWPENYYDNSTFINTSNNRSNTNNLDLRWYETWVQKKWNVKQAYVGTTLARPTYNPWIYWNKAKWLISISSDWKKWRTIADKNLGAKVVWKTGDTPSVENAWFMYQRWNNYGFNWSGFSTTTTRVNASNYWPTNPYYGSTFIKTSNDLDWSTSVNNDLWWSDSDPITADQESDPDLLWNRKWPCPTWWHIPHQWDTYLITTWVDTLLWHHTWADFQTYLLRPNTWYLGYNSWSLTNTSYMQTWTSWYNPDSSYVSGKSRGASSTTSNVSNTAYNRRATWYPIRPVKDVPVVPDNSRAVLYQPS